MDRPLEESCWLLQPEDVLCYYLLFGDVVIDGQGQGKARQRVAAGQGAPHGKYVLYAASVAHPTPAPQRKEASSYIQMTAIKRCHISHCDNHCSHAMSLPKPASRISCCVFQPSQQQQCCVYLTSQASAMTPRLPPLPSQSPSLPSHAHTPAQTTASTSS
jgi:hypothetical protein